MNKVLIHTLAFSALVLPAIALAHGGVDDGHIEADGHSDGTSALLVAGSVRWFGLLAFSTLLTALLSYGVYRYIQVAPVKMSKPEIKEGKK